VGVNRAPVRARPSAHARARLLDTPAPIGYNLVRFAGL